MTGRSRVWLVLALALGAGCNDAQKQQNAKPVESAKPKSKLEKEMAAAAAASATAAAGQAGPPPNGVFPPGGADEAQPANAPPKITVIKSGDDPKVKLTPEGLAPGTRLSLAVGAQLLQGPMPVMDYALEVAGDKDDKGKPTKAASAQPAASPLGRPIVFRVVKAEVDPKMAAKLPDGAGKLLGKLNGATVSAVLTPSGSLASTELAVPGASKDEAKDLAMIGGNMVEALELFFSPVPAEPVGAGANWIASDRTRIDGMPIVRYRVTTVQKLMGDDVVLGVEVRQYAASDAAVPEGLPDGLETLLYDSFSNDIIYTRKAGELLPLGGKLKVPHKMVLGQGGQPVQNGQFRTVLQAELRPPEPPKDKK